MLRKPSFVLPKPLQKKRKEKKKKKEERREDTRMPTHALSGSFRINRKKAETGFTYNRSVSRYDGKVHYPPLPTQPGKSIGHFV